jgi:hypothetical protein
MGSLLYLELLKLMELVTGNSEPTEPRTYTRVHMAHCQLLLSSGVSCRRGSTLLETNDVPLPYSIESQMASVRRKRRPVACAQRPNAEVFCFVSGENDHQRDACSHHILNPTCGSAFV